jgi:hypothetical protein
MLFPQNNIETMYQLSDEALIETTVEIDDTTKDLGKHMQEQWDKLVKPYSLTNELVAKLDNNVHIQFDDLSTWIEKIIAFDTGIKTARKELPAATDFSHGESNKVALDPDYVDQIKANIDSYVTSLEEHMATYDTLNKLGKDKTAIAEVVTLLEFMNNDLKHFVEEYEKIYSTVTLARENIISPDLRSSIILSTEKEDGPLKMKIVHIGTEEDNFIIYTKRVLWKNPVTGHALVPVNYYGYQLQGQYFLTDRFEYLRKYSETEKEMGFHLHSDECLGALNRKDLTDTLDRCKFVYSTENFVPTETGILFFNVTKTAISAINAKAGETLTEEDLPFHYSFNNTLLFHDVELGQVEIKRYSTSIIERCNYNQEDREEIIEKFHHLNEVEDTDFITLILEKEYQGVILNFSVITIVGILYYIIRYFYFKLKMRHTHRRPINKAIIKNLRAKSKTRQPTFY